MKTREAETGGEQPVAERKTLGRRRLLAALAAGGGGTLLTQQWAKPIVDLVVVPLHAQGSPVPCPTTGTYSCGGITFTASATLIVGTQCKGGSAMSGCCDQVVWQKPANGSHKIRVTLSHSSGQTLSVKLDYFTFNAVGCTSSGTFGDTSVNDIAPGQTLVYDGFITGDMPECVGLRVVEVKFTSGGAEVVACKGGPCNSGVVTSGDFGIYATLWPAGVPCPA